MDNNCQMKFRTFNFRSSWCLSVLVLHQGSFGLPGAICQCLDRFLIFMTWEWGLAGIRWVETRDAARRPTQNRAAPQ